MNEYQKDLRWAMRMAVLQEGRKRKIILTESHKQRVMEASYNDLYKMVFGTVPEHKLIGFLEATGTMDTMMSNMRTAASSAGERIKSGAQASSTSITNWTKNMVDKYPATSWAVIGIVTAVSISAAAFFIYKRFISKSGRYCAKLRGQDKKECFAKFKSNAIRATLLSLNNAKRGCTNTRNPAKCEINYDKKIRFWWKRLQDQERRNAEVL